MRDLLDRVDVEANNTLSKGRGAVDHSGIDRDKKSEDVEAEVFKEQ